MKAWAWTLLALALAAGPALAAARARLGGTLSIGLVGLAPPSADAAADSPEGASARALLALPLCRLLPGAVPVLASLSRASTGAGEEVQLVPVPGARFPDGTPLSAADVADAWRRLARVDSPYLALLAPVAGLGQLLEEAPHRQGAALRLPLAYAWPDLEASLCHPALTPYRPGAAGGAAQGIALYTPGPQGRLLANRGAPGGPVFPSALSFSSLPARTAQRLLQKGDVQVLLGEAPAAPASALLYATYLVYTPASLPEGALGALQALDVDALVRTFVPGPAVALHGLLPPSLLDGPAPAPAAAPPVAKAVARPFTLGYAAGAPDQRAVAERLQVLLHDAGYPVRLHADTPAGLVQARRAGGVQAALVSVLLPPLPAPALALVLGLAQDGQLLQRELPALGAEADGAARAGRVAQRARALAKDVPVLPLYVRGLRASLADGLLDAHRDGFGLLVLDDAWLAR